MSVALHKSDTLKLPTLYCIAGALGWKVIADRLSAQIAEDKERFSKLVVDYPLRFSERVCWRVNYGSERPLHLPLVDPCRLNLLHLARLAKQTDRYSRVVAATQEQAYPFVNLQSKRPVFLMCDVTRHLHASCFGSKNVSERHYELERQIYRRCEHIFALSNWVRDDLISFYGFPSEKVTLCPPPFNSLGHLPSKKTIQQRDKVRVLFVGGDFIRKGGDLLISWQRSRLHRHVDLTIVTDQKYHDCTIPSTSWIGSISNGEVTKKLMPAHDLLCHPTQKDCSAIVVVEAAAVGMPAVASNVGGISDLIENGVTGILQNKDDHRGFQDSILGLCHDRERLTNLSEAAWQFAKKNLSPHDFYGKITSKLH